MSTLNPTMEILAHNYLCQPSASPNGKFYRFVTVKYGPDYYVALNWAAVPAHLSSPMAHANSTEKVGQYDVHGPFSASGAAKSHEEHLSKKMRSGYKHAGVVPQTTIVPVEIVRRIRLDRETNGQHFTAEPSPKAQAEATSVNLLNHGDSLSAETKMAAKVLESVRAGDLQSALALHNKLKAHHQAQQKAANATQSLLETTDEVLRKAL